MSQAEAMETTEETFKEPEKVVIEKQQEQMLKAKYPHLSRGGGGSALLHKQLHSKQKFFDSGDYNMAKSRIGHKSQLTANEKEILTTSTGHSVPTAEEVHKRVTHRTSSLVVDDPDVSN